MNHKDLNIISAEYGDSFFVLDGERFSQNFLALRKAFLNHYEDVKIGYSYKTNYTPQLCQLAHQLGGYAEVVSEMEYAHAKRLGVPGDRIIFNGPVKAKWALEEAALSGAIINLDSKNDLKVLSQLAKANPAKQLSLVVRVNFPIGSSISRFGMDIEGSEFHSTLDTISDISNLCLKGLHCHFPDRDLESFKRRAEEMVKLVLQVFDEHPPELINIGGGFFSNMPDSLRATFEAPPATFEDYGKVIGAIFTKAFKGKKKPTLFLEPGTALVADAQNFYTRVVSIKTIRNKQFATVAGSSFDISPRARSKDLPVKSIVASSGGKTIKVDVVGFTCIEDDILTEDLVTSLEPGDFLCYSNVGSYSIVMRPPFILPSAPILFDSGTGELALIKKRQSNEDIFHDFIY